MIDMPLHTFFVLLHIVSTALGVGGATVCDYLFLKTIHQNTIHRSEYVFLKLITNIVMVGLGILIFSGAGFMVLYVSEKPEALMNPKLWAKVTIVGILTVNGWIMHSKILPLFKERIGKKLLNENIMSRTKLLLTCGTISAVSWYVALILGVWRELNFKFSYFEVLGAYGALLVLSLFGANTLGRYLLKVQSRSPVINSYTTDSMFLDGLTGLYNSRFLDDYLPRQVSASRRHGHPLSVIFVDLDGFGQINGLYGDKVGNAVLREVGQMILKNCRIPDTVFRYGGDEFVIALPYTQQKDAMVHAERLKDLFSRQRFDVSDETGITKANCIAVSASIGMASYHSTREMSGRDLIQGAEQQAYVAKKQGNNLISKAS